MTDENIETSEITIKEFEALILELKWSQDKYKDAKKIASEHHQESEKLKLRILAVLEQLGKTSYLSDIGTVSKKVRWSWKVPKEQEARNSYRNFLEKRDEFDGMWTIHSASMNAHSSELLKDAQENGDIDFEIPGLAEPTPSETVSLTKR